MTTTPVLELHDVGLTRNGRVLLDGIDWIVAPGSCWVVLGPNGSGKTSLARIASLYEHPSRGTVDVLGERLGRTDVRSLRTRVALVSAAMADQVRGDLDPLDVVVTARHGALEPWWHTYTDDERDRARACLEEQHVGHTVGRRFATLSSGERQRVLLARALIGDPSLVILDEPAAGLDLGGREELVERMVATTARPDAPALVLVTHHVEEIPPTAEQLLAVRSGRIVASGPVGTTLDADLLERLFDVRVRLQHRGGRWTIVPAQD